MAFVEYATDLAEREEDLATGFVERVAHWTVRREASQSACVRVCVPGMCVRTERIALARRNAFVVAIIELQVVDA